MPGCSSMPSGTITMKCCLSWPSTWRTAADTRTMPELPSRRSWWVRQIFEVLLLLLAVLVLEAVAFSHSFTQALCGAALAPALPAARLFAPRGLRAGAFLAGGAGCCAAALAGQTGDCNASAVATAPARPMRAAGCELNCCLPSLFSTFPCKAGRSRPSQPLNEFVAPIARGGD